MTTLEEAVATYEQYALDAKQEKLNETYRYYTQLADWLSELQERRKEQYLTIEQIAVVVGPQTIYSARLWFEFARTLDILGYAVVKRRTE